MNQEKKVEYIDVLDEFGNITGIIKTREKIKRDKDYYRIVLLWIYNPKLKKILVQRRSKNKESSPNKWDLTVGGHIKAGESSLDAIIRETKEEIGIDISNDIITKVLEVKPSENKPKFTDIYLVIKEVDINDIKLQLEEVSEIKYFSIKELIDLHNSNNQEFIHHLYFPELIEIVKKIIN